MYCEDMGLPTKENTVSTKVHIKCANCELEIKEYAITDGVETFFVWGHPDVMGVEGFFYACNVAKYDGRQVFPVGTMATHPNSLSAAEWVKVSH